MELAGPKIRIDAVLSAGESNKVVPGNLVLLTNNVSYIDRFSQIGENVVAAISCNWPEALIVCKWAILSILTTGKSRVWSKPFCQRGCY